VLMRAAGKVIEGQRDLYQEEIVLYARARSRPCRRVRRLLERKGYAFEEVDVGDDELRLSLIETTGRKTLPLAFWDGRLVGGHNRADVGTGHGLKEVSSISRLGPYSPKSRRDLLEICLNSSGSSLMCKADQYGSQRVNRSVPIDNRSVRQKAVGISPLENLWVSCSRFQPFGTLLFTRVRGRSSPKVKC
jgi:glutaredoxin 3